MQGKKKTLLLPCQTNWFNMKIIHFILVLFYFILAFTSCHADVDLYADYKDVPIVYAMLNPSADTNFVKITRAFCGANDNPINANEVALIADSCNYPGKLDVRIIELKSTNGGPYTPTRRVIQLDTMTIHNKQEGTFYAPHQKLYYTTEPFNVGTIGNRYKYGLVVVKPDGDSLTAQTSIVGNEEFCIVSSSASFQITPTDALERVIFRADGVAPVYEVKMQFDYIEQHPNEIAKKQVSRSFGVHPLWEYNKIEYTDNSYYLEYSCNWLFNALMNAIGDDTIVNPNHPEVVRYIGDFIVSVTGAGEDLYCYYAANQSQQNNPVGFVSIYSNIDGGYGLFSSRNTINKVMHLSSNTKKELLSISSWGFKEQ